MSAFRPLRSAQRQRRPLLASQGGSQQSPQQTRSPQAATGPPGLRPPATAQSWAVPGLFPLPWQSLKRRTCQKRGRAGGCPPKKLRFQPRLRFPASERETHQPPNGNVRSCRGRRWGGPGWGMRGRVQPPSGPLRTRPRLRSLRIWRRQMPSP